MSFWSGFLDQWNYEDDKKAKEKDAAKAEALERDKLNTARQIELIKLGATRGAKNSGDLDAMKSATLWMDSMIPKGTPGREDFFSKIQRDPKVALDIQKAYDAQSKDWAKKGIRPMRGEDIMSVFQIVQDNISGGESPNITELLKQARDFDLSKSSNYIPAYDTIANFQPVTPTSALIKGDLSSISPAQEKSQNEFFNNAVEKKAIDFLKIDMADPKAVETLKSLGITMDYAQTIWKELVDNYLNNGNVDAGVVVTNTLGMWPYIDKASDTAPLLNHWQQNSYFANVLNASMEDDTGFLQYLVDKSNARSETRTLQ